MSSIPATLGAALKHPQCLTCTSLNSDPQESSTATSSGKVSLSWENWDKDEDDDYEENGIPIPFPTVPAQRRTNSQRKRKLICQYYSAVFAPNNNEMVLIECLGPEVPTSAVYRVSVDPTMKPLTLAYLLQNNTALKERIEKIALPQIKTFPVMISGGYHAQVRLYLPPGLREEEITKYPMIVHV